MPWLSQGAASLLSPSLSLFSGREEYGFVCKTHHTLGLQVVFGSPPMCPHASLWILTCAFLYSWPNAVSRTPLFMATLEPVHRLCFPQCDSHVPLYVYQSLLPLHWRKEERRKGGSGEGRKALFLLTIWRFQHGWWGLVVGTQGSCHSKSKMNPGTQDACYFLFTPGAQPMGSCLLPSGWFFSTLINPI